MKEAPSTTFAHLLEDLYTVPGEFIACLEWRRISNDRMRRDIQTRRRHFFNKRVSLVNYVAPDTRPEEMLVDESASATVKQLGDALTELDVNGHFFGECSLALVLFDRDAQALERMTAEAIKVMAAHDGAVFEETYNLLNAWLSVDSRQQRSQPPPAGAPGDELRRSELPLHARRRPPTVSSSESRCARNLRDAPPDAVSLHAARPGRRPCAGARRHRQRQELPAEFPPDARAEIRPA